jgi:excinuclease UvrABC ATPase subunit
MTKPDVESITGILPAVAIEQKAPPRNPRSTVGTITEIYDYIRALYARIGKTICSECDNEIRIDNPINIADTIINSINTNNNLFDIDDKIYIMIAIDHKQTTPNTSSPAISDTSFFMSEIERLIKIGFSRIVDIKSNEIVELNDFTISTQTNTANYYILVDR